MGGMKQGKALYVPYARLIDTLSAQKGIHSARDKSILMLSHYMGLRAMELAALTIGDVFDASSGKIRETVRLLVTKGQHFREVPLVNEAARETLRRYLLTRSVRLADTPLFLSQRGGGFSANTMQRLVAICYQRAGVKGSSHSGRRSYATNLIQAGADIYTVQILMGHSSIMTTQEYFTTSPVRMAKFAALLA